MHYDYNKAGRVSIHASRTGGDITGEWQRSMGYRFNPRLPHGRRPVVHGIVAKCHVSIHASRTGGDRRVVEG